MSDRPLRLDLTDFIRFGWKHKKWIIGFAFLAALVTAGVMLMKKNTYKAYGSFFPSSAVISGRVNLFREFNQEWIDLFGGENEVDRIYVLGNASPLVSKLIEEYKIYEHYGIDPKKDKNGMMRTYKRFMKNYSFTRSGFKHLEVSFEDRDDALAAKVVNTAMNWAEQEMKEIYMRSNNEISRALTSRSDSIQEQIDVLTDSLVNVRTKYGVYDIVSPGRKNLIMGKASGSGPRYARGLEEVQSLSEIKDKLVVDRGRYASLSNEFKTATHYDIPMIHVVQWAEPGAQKAGPHRTLNVLGAAVAGFLFAWLLSVLYEFFVRNKESFIGELDNA